MSTIRLPAIPGTIGLPSEVRRVLEPLKQTVEILTSVRGDSATELIGGEKIRRKTIAQLQLGDNSVDGHNIVNNAVGTAKIGDQAVTTGKIANQAVGQAQIDDLAVGTAQIQTAAVGAAQIADLSVGTAEIANAAITQAKIANLAVGTAQIQDAAINNAKIGNLEVTNAKIANLAVDNIKIGTDAVSTGKVQANAITAQIVSTTTSTVNLGFGATTLNTIVFTTSGGPLLLLYTGYNAVEIPTSGSVIQEQTKFEIRRNGSPLAGGGAFVGGTIQGGSGNQLIFDSVALSNLDQPLAGTYTYTVTGNRQTGNNGNFSQSQGGTFTVAEFKR